MEDPKLYQNNNSVQRRDAIRCLDTFTRNISWRKIQRVVDIGCGDGGLTNILQTYLPTDSKLLGCDISEKMIDFANNKHGDQRKQFMVLDIQGEIPHALRENFDHAFSFYCLHWIQNHEVAFRNIYKLLAENGDCLLMFLGHMPIFDVYRSLSRNNKWGAWLSDVDCGVSPYHDSQEPEKEIKNLLLKVGFNNCEVTCKKEEYQYDTIDMFKRAMTAINAFKIPRELFEDYLEDFIQVIADKKVTDLTINNIGEESKIKVAYTLIVINAAKCTLGPQNT